MADALSTIRTRIAFRLGNRAGMDTKIDENLNEAILQIIWEHRPFEMQTSTTFTTADGDFDYTIAAAGDIAVADLYAIEMVRNNTDNRRLVKGTYWEFENQDQTGSDATGEPTKWFRRGNTLFLYNLVPDATSRTIRVSYLKRHTALSADSDTFPLNDEWLKPAEHLTVALTWADLNLPDLAGLAQQAYVASVGARETAKEVEDESPDGNLLFDDGDL